MVGRLSAVFHLPQALVDVPRRLTDGLGEQLIVHEVGAGAGGQKAAVPDQLHGPQVDLPVSLDRLFHRGCGTL